MGSVISCCVASFSYVAFSGASRFPLSTLDPGGVNVLGLAGKGIFGTIFQLRSRIAFAPSFIVRGVIFALV